MSKLTQTRAYRQLINILKSRDIYQCLFLISWLEKNLIMKVEIDPLEKEITILHSWIPAIGWTGKEKFSPVNITGGIILRCIDEVTAIGPVFDALVPALRQGGIE